MIQRENEISEVNSINENLEQRIHALEEEQQDLIATIDDLRALAQSPNKSPVIIKNGQEGESKEDSFDEIISLANDIKEKLTAIPLDGQDSPTPIAKLAISDAESTTEFLYNVLKQIQQSVTMYSEGMKHSMNDSEATRNDYDNLLTIYNKLKADLDNFVSRSEAEAAIEEIENVLYEKEQELNELRDEKSELWNNIRVVNQGLADIERERAGLIQLNKHLMQKNEELREFSINQSPALEELEALSKSNDELQDELDYKEKELQSINLEYSNCEAELEAKNAEIKALQERVKSLKVLLETHNESGDKFLSPKPSFEQNLFERNMSPRKSDASVIIHSRSKSASEIVKYILQNVQDYYNKDATIDDLTDHIDEIFESTKQFDEIEEQLNEANKVSTELTALIDEKLAEITELNSKIEATEGQEALFREKIVSLEKEIEAKTSESETANMHSEEMSEKILLLENERDAHKSEIENLRNDAQIAKSKVKELELELKQRTSEIETSERHIEELEENIKALEIDLEAEQALRSELDQIRTDFEKASEELDDLNNENLDLEARNSELSADLDKQHEEYEELQAQIQDLQSDNRVQEIQSLKAHISELEKTVKDQAQSNTDLQQRLAKLIATKDNLTLEIDKKSNALGEIARRKGQLDRDMQLLHQNYNNESKKAVNLERQVLSLVQASSTSTMLNASNVGSIFKQQTYQRMLELDKEVQSLRDKMKTLENELKDRNLKFTKRGTDFAVVISDILLALQRNSDSEWQTKIGTILEEIRRNSSGTGEDYKRLGGIIREGIQHLKSE